MEFDWREFLLLAHRLRHIGADNEADHRTAVGRAYYYAYNEALAEGRKLGYNPNAPSRLGVHRRLWQWYSSYPDPQVAALGVMGATLHARRIEADYHGDMSGDIRWQVQRQLEDTREFEILLARVADRPEPPPLALNGTSPGPACASPPPEC